MAKKEEPGKEIITAAGERKFVDFNDPQQAAEYLVSNTPASSVPMNVSNELPPSKDEKKSEFNAMGEKRIFEGDTVTFEVEANQKQTGLPIAVTSDNEEVAEAEKKDK